ncbi:hypothetical protein F5Y09DRAFT_348604 [Xylaria sp. FL1042]|nr:hypothetical protein F5Y09DRAFT_348604 [Xylaria sp. FL1042]
MSMSEFPSACVGDGRPEWPSQGRGKPPARHYLDMYVNQPDDDAPFVADDTLKERDRVWNSWIRFCDDYHLRNKDAWITFAHYPERAEAQAPFRGFLHRYVDDLVQKRPILEPEKYKDKQMLDSAHSVTEIWRRLVALAEHCVFKPKRREGGSAAAALKLRWISKEEGERKGPAYRIVKVEMTSTDAHAFLVTLLTRADAICAKPQSRALFHRKFLLAAIGGFRRSILKGIKYSQLQVAALRDLKDRSRTKIVVTIKIRRNKIKETAKTVRKRNSGWISFSITLVSNRAFCFASLIFTQAINDQAFKAEYNTVDDIFEKPNLETLPSKTTKKDDFGKLLLLPNTESSIKTPSLSLSSENSTSSWPSQLDDHPMTDIDNCDQKTHSRDQVSLVIQEAYE